MFLQKSDFWGDPGVNIQGNEVSVPPKHGHKVLPVISSKKILPEFKAGNCKRVGKDTRVGCNKQVKLGFSETHFAESLEIRFEGFVDISTEDSGHVGDELANMSVSEAMLFEEMCDRDDLMNGRKFDDFFGGCGCFL